MSIVWYRYRGKRHHYVGEYFTAGKNHIMLLPEHIDKLGGNHEHLIIVYEKDPKLVEEKHD